MTAVQEAVHQPATPPVLHRNGDVAVSAPWGDVYKAAAYEEDILRRADTIWAKSRSGVFLTGKLLAELWPILRLPLHPGHIIRSTPGKGKPYESDGARSVQVLIDRMNNVLRPWNWRDRVIYEENGTLADVIVEVTGVDGKVLITRSSYGGVNQANTAGNLHKGSYTNAAKLAFARIGPGHEIYTQSIDYDPDLSPEALSDQAAPPVAAAAASAPAPRPEAQLPAPDHAQVITDLLAIDDDLTEVRLKAVQAFRVLGATERQIARDVGSASASGRRDLESLVTRVNNAINAQAAAPPAPPSADPGAAS